MNFPLEKKNTYRFVQGLYRLPNLPTGFVIKRVVEALAWGYQNKHTKVNLY